MKVIDNLMKDLVGLIANVSCERRAQRQCRLTTPWREYRDAEGEDIGSHTAEMFDDCCPMSEE